MAKHLWRRNASWKPKSRSAHPSLTPRRLRFEPLESRQLLAVTVIKGPTPGDVYVPAGATIPVMVDAGLIGNLNDPNAENIFTFSASSDNAATSVLVPQGPTVKITVPNYGVMTFKLFTDTGLAPNTAQHFIDLMNQGVFNNTEFYRVSRPNNNPFVIQGGPGGAGAGGQIDNEFSPYLQYTSAGILAMANAGDDTNSSEFFVTGGATRFLDYNYSIFGYLVTGDGVRKNIQNAPVNGETPTTPIKIQSITPVDDPSHAILLIHADEGATGDFTVTVNAHHVTEGDGGTQITVHIQPDTTDEIPYLQPPGVLNVPYQTPTSVSGFLTGTNIQNVQALTRAPLTDGGTFAVEYNGNTTSAQAWNVSAADLQTALQGLDPDLADCTVTLTGGTYTVRMHKVTGDLAIADDQTTAGGSPTSGMVAGPGMVYGYDPDNTDPGLTVTVNANTGDVQVDPGNSAPGVKKLTVEVRATDHDANTGTDTQAVPVFILPPAPTGLQLSAASDTGSDPGDGLINRDNSSPAKALQFTVDGVTAGMSVIIHAKNTTTLQEFDLPTTSADGVHFTTTGATKLPDGVYEFTAKQSLHVADINVGNDHSAADLESATASPIAQVTIQTVAPQFTSTAPDKPNVIADTPFSYTAQAQTAGGDLPVYSLVPTPGHVLPDNATIDPSTGEVSWTPRLDQRPLQWITVRAMDVYGNYSDQPFQVHVTDSSGNVYEPEPQFECSSGPGGAAVDHLTLRLTADGQGFELLNSNTGEMLLTQPTIETYSLTLRGGTDAGDPRTIHLTMGSGVGLPGGVIFQGGGADTLVLHGAAPGNTFELDGQAVAVNGQAVSLSDVKGIRLVGGSGNNVFKLSSSSVPVTVVDPGGRDTLDFSGAAGGISVNLAQVGVAQAIAPWGTTLTIFGPVANLIGTNYNDVLRGNAATNIIRGLGGDDRLFAGTGSAVLVGGAGHNVLRGGPGKNVLIAGLGSSTVVGGSGPSILIGGYTNVDANDQALLALLAQGPQAAVRNGRIAYARSGRRITSALPAGIKVLSTGAHDALFAGSGFTWFLTAGNSSINQSAPLGSAGSLSLSATRLGQGSTKVASVPTTTAAAPTVAVPQPSSLTPLQRAALSRRMLGR